MVQNVREDVDLSLPWLNPRSSADEDRRALFAQLKKIEVKQLFEAYKVDHDLFGYNIEPYFSLAKDSSA